MLLDELTDDELDGFLRGMRALREARARLGRAWALPETVTNPATPTTNTDEASR